MTLGGDASIVIAGEGDPEIDAQVLKRAQAKKAKNFAEADRIREELKAKGIEVTDTKEGPAGGGYKPGIWRYRKNDKQKGGATEGLPTFCLSR